MHAPAAASGGARDYMKLLEPCAESTASTCSRATRPLARSSSRESRQVRPVPERADVASSDGRLCITEFARRPRLEKASDRLNRAVKGIEVVVVGRRVGGGTVFSTRREEQRRRTDLSLGSKQNGKQGRH